MSATNFCQPLYPSPAGRAVPVSPGSPKLMGIASLAASWSAPLAEKALPESPGAQAACVVDCIPAASVASDPVDPFYLFACHIEWEQDEDTGAAWELLAAAQSGHQDTRAHARALLGRSRHFGGPGLVAEPRSAARPKRSATREASVKTPYGLEIVDNCTECSHCKPGFFCSISRRALEALNQASHKSTLPAGAVLFVEGQTPRGVFIICSGKVNLSTTSREGKILILKTADAGEALGLSAAISGVGYETTAETATPCQVNFVDRQNMIELMQAHTEIGVQAAQSLSRDFQSAYRDIRDLILTRSSAGKLARLLLQQPEAEDAEAIEIRIASFMTHEEMAQRIGSSRETVTRLLSDLKRRQLIRLEGSTLIIPNRTALEALAI